MFSEEEQKIRHRESVRRHRLTHLEQIKAKTKAYRLMYPEQAKARDKAYRLAHPERIKAQRKAWTLAHLEQEKMRRKTWALAHPEKVRAINRKSSRRYRLAHPKEIKVRVKAWALAHPENTCTISQRYRTRKLDLPNTLTIFEWQAICAAYKYRCAYCGKKRKLTQDHVLALSKGGGTIAMNTVPACLSCNSAKGNRLPSKPVKLALGI